MFSEEELADVFLGDAPFTASLQVVAPHGALVRCGEHFAGVLAILMTDAFIPSSQKDGQVVAAFGRCREIRQSQV